MPRIGQSRTLRVAAAGAALAASLTLTGCGFDVQTLQPYTPAQGVNTDVANGPKIRNILVIANSSGKGRLSAALVSQSSPDALASVTGTALKTDGTPGDALTIGSTHVTLPAGRMVVLTGTDAPTITVASPDLTPGHNVRLKLTFASGAITEITVPVVDAKVPMYATAAPELA